MAWDVFLAIKGHEWQQIHLNLPLEVVNSHIEYIWRTQAEDEPLVSILLTHIGKEKAYVEKAPLGGSGGTAGGDSECSERLRQLPLGL